MKTYKEIIREAKASGESPRRDKEFKDKHVIQKINHPVAGDDQFAAPKIKKDKTKHASHHDGDDMAVYEEVEQLDELSPNTLHSYIKKSAGNMAGNAAVAAAQASSSMGKSTPDVKRKIKNRMQGITGASGRLADKANQNEEVELDELSQNTLWNYHAKAGADLQAKRKKLEQGKLTMQDLKKGQNRVKGLNRAADKMHEEMSDTEMKKREDIVKGMKKNKEDFKKRYGDRWKSVMYATATKNAMESVEQIDELSKKTLGSYIKKAKTDVAGQAYQLGAKDPLKPKASWSKALGREKHIDKAVDRLTKESVDLDEVFKAGSMKLKDGSSISVTSEQASTLNALFTELNSSNQKKMQERLMSSTDNFNEILAFAKAAL